MLLQLSCAHGFAAVVGLPLASRCRRRPIRCNYTCLRDQSANVRPSSCRSPKALSWMPKIFSFLSPVDMLNSVLYQYQQAICGMASRSAMAGCCLLAACCLQSTLLAPPAVCVLDDSLHVACKPLTLASLARHYYCMRLPYLPAHPPPRSARLQILTGSQIQKFPIPYLPQEAQIVQAWFAGLPLIDTTYSIPGAILATSPVSINYDPDTGATPSYGIGIVFALNP